jgi:hypothetical protein
MTTPLQSHSRPVPPLGDTAFSASPERAQAYLASHGVLILDDNSPHLEAVASVCIEVLDIPASQIVLIHASSGLLLSTIISETEAALRKQIELTGASFGSIITDYNLSGGMTSLEVWRAIDASFKATEGHEYWQRTGRVLMSASPRESEIIEAQHCHLIDRYISKPFNLSTFEDAVVASVLKRLS